MGAEPLPVRFDGEGDRSRIGVLVLEQGDRPVVVLDAALVERLDAALDSLPHDCAGLVVASGSERSFVAGADLRAIMSLDDQGLHSYLKRTAEVFGRLSQLAFPTAAAIGGAALGGGLELAMHCDGLVAAPSASGKAYAVGLPEAGLAICPGWGGTNLLPARMEAEDAIRRTATGRALTFDEACDADLFDVVCDDAGELIDRAVAWVSERPRPERTGAPSRWIGREACRAGVRRALEACREEIGATQAGAAVADCVAVGLDEGWEAAIARERDHLVRLRRTPEATGAIEAFFAKTAKR